MNRTVAVFTGNRAEFGLLLPVIRQIQKSANLQLQLIVSGAHLDESFGRTLDQILQSGLPVAATLSVAPESDDLVSTTKAIASGIAQMAETLRQLQPDILIVYADRYEGFAAVVAAAQMRIPVAHVEGGDVTEGGALDDSLRHAMTKLSHLHFTTNEAARKNVLQLGEEPWRVFNVGLPSLDDIAQGQFATEAEIINRFGFNPASGLVVFTQHSVTTEFDHAADQVRAALVALSQLVDQGVQVVLTYPNNDAGGMTIVEKLTEFATQQRERVFLVPSLGGYFYHGLLNLARNPQWRVVVAGNSSSGIKETPVFGCPAVNIGSRQDGRLRAGNVVDVDYDPLQIKSAIEQALFDDSYRQSCAKVQNPYGDGKAAERIVKVLTDVTLGQRLIAKKTLFY